MNRNIVAYCSINSQVLKINFGICQSMSLLRNEIDCYFARFISELVIETFLRVEVSIHFVGSIGYIQ